MKSRIVRYIGGLVLILAAVGGWFYFRGDNEGSEGQYLTEQVSRGSIRRTVTSTGALQAVVTVQVGSQVSGRIQELHADFNSVVKKNQILAVIDPANFLAQRERARAALATSEAAVKNADANLINRQAELTSSKANLQVSRVTEQEAERQLSRAKELFEDNLISERDLESAQADFDQSTARVQQSEAQVRQVDASIRSALAQREQALANVKQTRAELQVAEVNLRYTKIISPIDGVVIERNVDIGQTVAASFQAPVLFLIANDLSKMQVIAQIDEADIGVISEKAGVDFSVDAFPSETFQGRISEIRLSSKLPTTSTTAAGTGGGATNVVVYNVIIDVDNLQLKLRPAMTANVNFTVASVEDTLKIANSALRYRPSDKSPEEIAKLMRASPGGPPGARPQGSPGRSAALARPSEGDGDSKSPGREQNQEDGQARQRWLARRGDGDRPSQIRRTRGLVIGPSTVEQYGIRAGPKIRFPEAEQARARRSLLWVLGADQQPEPRRVQLGITDGRETAILSGELDEGETVITWKMDDEAAVRAASPFSGAFGPRRTRRGSSSGRTGGQRRGGRQR